jgi:exonuclease III
MRIVSWNCNGAFRRKFHLIEDLDPDVVIIQECEDPARHLDAFADWSGNYLWAGKNQNRGIGVFSRSGSILSQLQWDDGGYSEFLPVRIVNGITILAVWTKGIGGSVDRYVGQMCNYLNLHGDLFDEKTVVCGDFNSNMNWDKPRKTWNHGAMVDDFSRRGFSSLYHARFGESQGEESTPTFYLHRKPDRPYHIDYVFLHDSQIHQRTASLEIGEPNRWLPHSDHMPLLVNL